MLRCACYIFLVIFGLSSVLAVKIDISGAISMDYNFKFDPLRPPVKFRHHVNETSLSKNMADTLKAESDFPKSETKILRLMSKILQNVSDDIGLEDIILKKKPKLLNPDIETESATPDTIKVPIEAYVQKPKETVRQNSPSGKVTTLKTFQIDVTFNDGSIVTETTRKESFQRDMITSKVASATKTPTNFTQTSITTTTTEDSLRGGKDIKVIKYLLNSLGMRNVPLSESFNIIRSDYIDENDTTTVRDEEEDSLRITQPYKSAKLKKIESNKKLLHQNTRLIKDDPKIKNFTLHVFLRALSTLNSLKSEVSDLNYKKQFDFIARKYKNEFENFVNNTQYQKIVTKLGTQKVILNTVDTSNRILNRNLNYLISELLAKYPLRDNLRPLVKYKLEEEEKEAYVYACGNFRICRSRNSYSQFLVDFFTGLLENDDAHLKQSYDALTEVLKYTDLDKAIADSDVSNRARGYITAIEFMDSPTLRSMTWMIRNVIANRNKPLVVTEGDKNSRPVIATVALTGIVDTLDANLLPDEANVQEWSKLKNDLRQYIDGKGDIADVMQRFMNHAIDKGISHLNAEDQEKINHNFRVLF